MSMSETTRLLNDKPNHSNENNDDQKKRNRIRTMVALASGMLVQSFLLIGVFPYSGFMAMYLIPNLNEESAGHYAGFIASSFMVGRTISSFEWGRIADRYGRVFVIKASLLLSAVGSLLFGLAPTYTTALAIRCMLGLCNGLMGPIKTIISEYNEGHKEKETQMTAVVMGCWGGGFLINPAITGYLADPVKQYPKAHVVQYFEPFLSTYPFFLPNLIGFVMCLICYGLVYSFVEETLPPDKLQTFGWFPWKRTIIRTVSSWGLFKHLHEEEAPSNDDGAILLPPYQEERRGQQQQQQKEDDEGPATIKSLWKRKATREHLLVYWFFSFIIVTVDESLPLYCLSKASGLNVKEKEIGTILSGSGLFYVTIQFFLLTGLVRRFGFYKTLRIGSLFSAPLTCLIPLSLLTNKNAPEGTLIWPTFLLLSGIYAIIRVFSLLVFSTLTMATNRTVPVHHRATMQGLSMLGGSMSKACGPAFAGILFSSSVGYFVPPMGSVVVFGIISILGVLFCVMTFLLQPGEDELEKAIKVEKECSIQDSSNDEEDKPPTF